jgi:phage-related minor tail protein
MGETLQTLGADLEHLDEFQERNIQLAEQVRAAYTTGNTALETYDENLRRHRAALRDVAEDTKAAAAYERDYNAAVKEDTARNDEIEKIRKENAEKKQAIADEITRMRLVDSVRAQVAANRAKDVAKQREERNETRNDSEEGGGSSFSGIELTNLAYRAKDIVDQLGAGSSITRVIAQQGSATVLDFKNQIVAFAAYIPVLAAAGAAIGVVGLAFARLYDESAQAREFNAQLALSVDGARYSTAALLETQKALEKVGVSFKEAGEALKIFVAAGIRPDRLEAFGETAEKLSRSVGISVPEAAKLMAEGLTRGYDSVKKLNEQFNFLSVSQNRQIIEADRVGNSAKANEIAFNALSAQVAKSADAIKGPFHDAIVAGDNAWHNFLDTLSNTGVFTFVSNVIGTIAHDLEVLTKGLKDFSSFASQDGGGKAEEAAIKSQIEALKKQRDDLKDAKSDLPADAKGSAAYDNAKNLDESRIAAYTASIDDLEKRLTAVQAAEQKASAATAAAIPTQKAATGQTQAATEAIDALIEARRRELENNRLDPAALRRRAVEEADQQLTAVQGFDANSPEGKAQKAKLEGEAVEKVNQEIAMRTVRQAASLNSELESLQAEADKLQKDSLESRLKAVDETYAKIFDKIKLYQQRGGGGSIGGMSIGEYEKQVEAAKEVEKQSVTQKFIEEQLNAVLADREQQLKSIAAEQKAGGVTALEAYQKIQAVQAKFGPQITKLANDALAFAKNIKGAAPGAEMSAFIDKAKGALGSNNASGPSQQVVEDAIKQADDIVKARKEMQATLDEQVKEGAVTQQQAEATLKKYYDDTAKSLQAAIAGAKQLVAALKGISGASPQVDILTGKVKALQNQQQYTSETTKALNEGITKAAGAEAQKAVSGMVDVFAKLANGTETFKQGLKDAAGVLEQFVAGFLEDIAKIILQKEAEIAVQTILDAVGGGTPGGGGAGATGGSSPLASLFHSGGQVGPGAGLMSRPVDQNWFRRAPRFHSGTVVGLEPNEQAAILQHGEEVLTKADPRNALNGGRGKGSTATPAINVRHVLVMDPDIVPQAMQGARGEQVTVSHIKANVPTLRQALNVTSRRQ